MVGGFRPAELFALRVNDVEPGRIRVDEAIKQAEKGADRLGDPKTEGSKAYVAISPALQDELDRWLQYLGPIAPNAWLFPSERPSQPIRPGNYLKRVLKPLAVTAGVGLVDTGKRTDDGKPIYTSDVTYQAMRRTCATYFRRDVKSAQTQLRHSTPLTTARHYLKSISSDHRAAVEALDAELCATPTQSLTQ
jgi:integrase